MEPAEPTTNTIIHENIRKIFVRSAVATSESVYRILYLAIKDVKPAKRAENTAITAIT